MHTPEEQNTQTERDRQYEVRRQERVTANRKPRSWAGLVFFLMLVCLALGIAAGAFVLRRADTNAYFGTIAGALLGNHTETATAPMVVNQIQRLNRLESVQYSIDTVVEGHRTSAVLPDLLFGDRLLLVVHGQVIAGVDLSQLKPENVQVSGKSITVDLPSSQIFTTRIDEGKTRVFARTTGLLVPADPNLESDTRRTAEQQIQEAATKDGILDSARSNARNSVEGLLRGLGFNQVTVR